MLATDAVEYHGELHELALIHPIPEEVRAWGEGLCEGTVNKPCRFYLDATRAGHSDFDIMVRGPSQAAITFDEKSEGLYAIEYKTTLPGEYAVIVKYNDRDIQGSPFPVRITFLSRHPSDVKRPRQKKTKKEQRKTKDEDDEANRRPQCHGSPDLGYGSLKRSSSKVGAARSRLETQPMGYKEEDEDEIEATEDAQLQAECTDRNNNTTIYDKPRSSSDESSHYSIPHLSHYSSPSNQDGIHDTVEVFSEEENSGPYVPEWKRRTGRISVTEGVGARGHAGRASLFVIEKCLEKIDHRKLVVAVEGPGRCPIKVFKNTLTSVNVLYVPEKPGRYRVHATHCGDTIEQVPFTFDTMPNSVTHTPVTSVADEVESDYYLTLWYGFDVHNSEVSCDVQTNDNKPIDSITTKKSRELIEIKFNSMESGQHSCLVILEQENDGILNVFDLYVPKAAGKQKSNGCTRLPKIPGRQQVTAGEEHYICAPANPNDYMAVSINGVDSADVSYRQRSDGSRLIGYRLTKTGRYSMAIKDSRDHYVGNPYELNVVDQMDRD